MARNMLRAGIRRLRREDGAEAVEFAFIGPLLFMLIFGLLYLLILFAAQISLGYATNVAVRYASIPVDSVASIYPSAAQVVTKVADASPFFSEDMCTPTLNNAVPVNQPVSLTMSCDYPNPAGRAFDALRGTFFGGGDEISSTVELSATAESRKE